MYIDLRKKKNLIFICDDIYGHWKVLIYLLDKGYNPTSLL